MAKKTEKTLIKELDMAQNYLDIAGVMLVVINAKQEVELINKKGCEILGYAENEILGSNWFNKFIPERIRADTRSAFIHHISGKGEIVRQHENPVRTKSGEELIIEWQNTILRDHNGAITGTLSSGNNITAHRQAEENIAISQQELITKHKGQGAFAQKYGNCSVCEVFKKATADPIHQIGEQFNNMMHVLEVKNQELEDAYKELKKTSSVLQQDKMASMGQPASKNPQ